MINVAAHVAAHQSSKRRQQEAPQPPPPPPATTPIPPLPPRPQPPLQQQYQQYQQYPVQPPSQLIQTTHPLSHLVDTATDPTTISLHLIRTNPKGKVFQSATLQTPTGETLYTINYDPSDTTYSGSISRSPSPPTTLTHPFFSTPLTAHWKRHTFRTKKLEFFLPWPGGKWGFDPAKHRWISDVHLLPGHEFQWVTVTHGAGYSLKCVDTTTGSDVCHIVVGGGADTTAVIYVPLGLIGMQEQLDELVCVAVAVDEMVWSGNGNVSGSASGSGNGEAGSLKNTFEGINGVLGAVSAASGGGGGGGVC